MYSHNYTWVGSIPLATQIFKQKSMDNREFSYNGVKIEVDLDLDFIIIHGIKNVGKIADLFKDCHNLHDAKIAIVEAIDEYICPICGRITETEECEFGCSFDAVKFDIDKDE